MRYITNSAEETERVGEEIGGKIKQPVVIALYGELGSGKTTLTRGIVRGLGVKDRILSPTFTILREYKGRLRVYHFDMYRVYSSQEVVEYEEFFYRDAVCVIEWAERITSILPRERIDIEIKIAGENKREIDIKWATF